MPTIQHQGATLAYELAGSIGEPILFIQGVGLIGRGWQPQVEFLCKNHQTLVFDNRGLGESALQPKAPFSIDQMADDARALMDAVGWKSCHVVGHSMGGVIAQRLVTHPQRVRSLSLLCTVARGADAVRLTPRILWTALRTNIGTKPARRRAFLELIYPRDYLATVDCAALAEQLKSLFGHDLAGQPPIAMKQAMALRKHDCTSELSKLAKIRTLVVSAAHDPIAAPRFGAALARLIPGARYVEIPDASHGVTIHQPARINELLVSHFATT